MGASIGSYRVLRKIGEGGMGAVFLGEHKLIGRHAAIKVLLPELSEQRSNVDRFFNEARATTTVSDPGIVQVFDFGYEDQTAYIVMEYLEGEQLNTRLKRLGALAPADALRVTRQVAGSLAAVHAAGLVHRDLKPDNLFMIRDPEALGGERPKILDFGIAKLGNDTPNRMVTRTGQVIGTPVYMSPEQCNGAAIDHRADIYSLGCVLFQMLVGRPPFVGPGLVDVISSHLLDQPPLPSSLAPHLPVGLDELVLRCLAKSPDARFANMTELHRACDAIMTRVSSGSSATMGAARQSAPTLQGGSNLSAATPVPYDTPMATTLGNSAGQLVVGGQRSRLGLWLGISVLAVGIGSAVAIITSGGGGDDVVVPAALPTAQPEPAIAKPLAPPIEPAITTPVPDPAQTPAPAEAVAPAVAEPAPAPVADPSAPVPARKRTAVKPARATKAKPTPVKPKPGEDLYDDRN